MGIFFFKLDLFSHIHPDIILFLKGIEYIYEDSYPKEKIPKEWETGYNPDFHLIKKDFYDKSHINNIDFTKNTTDSTTIETSFVYSFLSSLRQKINKPVKRKKP